MDATIWEQAAAPAENYERDLVPVLFEPWVPELVELTAPKPGERVLDLACGTGIVARIAAGHVAPSGAVTGVDVNGSMLAVARRTGAAVRPSIEWRQANAIDTGLPDAAYDVVFCQQGLQFVPDRRAAVRELYRLTAPAGRVAVSVWCDPDSPGYAPLPATFARHCPQLPEATRFVHAIFGLPDPDELRQLLTGAGFREVRVIRRSRTVRHRSAEAWVRAFLGAAPIPGIAGLAAPVRERIISDAAAAMRDGSPEGFQFPMAANVAIARR